MNIYIYACIKCLAGDGVSSHNRSPCILDLCGHTVQVLDLVFILARICSCGLMV